MNARTSINHNEAFSKTLTLLLEAQAIAEEISETDEPARYEAQQASTSAAWNALAAVVDAHTAQAVADALKPLEAKPTEQAV